MKYLNHSRKYVNSIKAEKLDRIINHYKSQGKFQDVSFILEKLSKFDIYSTINEESTLCLENIKKACEEWRGNANWSFDVQFDILDDGKILNPTLNLVILYPHLTLTNLYGQTQEIKDLVVFIPMYIDPLNNHFELSTEIKGKRFLHTVEEIYSDYSHSHLYLGNIYSIASFVFCLGESEYNPFVCATTAATGNYTDYDSVVNVILNLENYLKHEATESNPHRRISDMLSLPSQKQETTLYETFNINSYNAYSKKASSLEKNWETAIQLIIQNNLVEPLSNSLDVYMVNNFLVFSGENTIKFESFIKNSIKELMLIKIEEEDFNYKQSNLLSLAFDLLYYKTDENTYTHFTQIGVGDFNLHTWLKNVEASLEEPASYYYQLNSRKLEFSFSNLTERIKEYDNIVLTETFKEQCIKFLDNFDNYRVHPALISEAIESLNMQANIKTKKEIHEKLIYEN